MNVIEISGAAGAGTVLRRQAFPDNWTVAGGVATSNVGHVIPTGGRWYVAPAGAKDGDTYDPGTDTLTPAPGPTIAEIRARMKGEVDEEASRRRNLLLGAPPGDADLALRKFLSLTARSVAKVRRETKGQGRPGETDELNQLETLADGLQLIDRGAENLQADIDASPDPASIDIINSPHWP